MQMFLSQSTGTSLERYFPALKNDKTYDFDFITNKDETKKKIKYVA
jgi:hypothetical protein